MTHDIGTLDLVLRLVAAVAVGLAVGVERELASQPAGLRTHLLVSLGAALFTVAGASVAHTDPTRVAAQVVTGIGFLGAGAVLREGLTVHGLTTAASLWVTAALGMAVGLGHFASAGVAALLAVGVLVVLKKVEADFFPSKRGQLITIDTLRTVDVREVVGLVEEVVGPVTVYRIRPTSPAEHRIAMKAKPASTKLPDTAQRLLDLDEVRAVEIDR